MVGGLDRKIINFVGFFFFRSMLPCRASKSLGSKNYCLVGRLTLESSVVLHSGQGEGGKIVKFDVFSFLKFSFSDKATKICALSSWF